MLHDEVGPGPVVLLRGAVGVLHVKLGLGLLVLQLHSLEPALAAQQAGQPDNLMLAITITIHYESSPSNFTSFDVEKDQRQCLHISMFRNDV